MNRKLFLLNGLAIQAVVANHASGWGITAMFWWAHRYLPVESPNFDQLGSASYWLLVLLKQLTVFSVPAFLFVSGAFMTYAGRGTTSTLNWRTLRARLLGLLYPYLIWSLVYFVWKGVQDGPYLWWEYPLKLLTGQAVGAFFYVPVLIQLLAISVWLVRWASRRPYLVLAISAVIQFALLALRYYQFEAKLPWLSYGGAPDWLCLNWIFFFTAGVVVSQKQPRIGQSFKRYRWVLLGLLLLAAVAAVLEPEWRARLSGMESWKGTALTLSTTLYSVLFVVTYLGFEHVELPFSKTLYMMGGKSYGIYLSHILVLELTARAIYHLAPFILAYQIIFQPLLILAGVAIPYLLISGLMKSPLRATSRYLFG